MQSHKREKEIRQAFAEKMADELDEVATSIGLTDEGCKTMKQKILNLAV